MAGLFDYSFKSLNEAIVRHDKQWQAHKTKKGQELTKRDRQFQKFIIAEIENWKLKTENTVVK